MLVPLKKIITPAMKNQTAIGAFNVMNLETAWSVAKAANSVKKPVIIQISESTLKYAGLPVIVDMIRKIASDKSITVPVAIHLDHGQNLKTISACLKAGFSSVHIDGSKYPLAKNIALTKKVMVLAKKYHAWVQGEVGMLPGNEDNIKNKKILLTDPAAAQKFALATKVNTLAISIGNVHGVKKIQRHQVPHLDLKRLATIHQLLPRLPLVLHGASGITTKDLRSAIKLGIRIVNIDSELRLAFTNTMRQELTAHQLLSDPRQALSPASQAVIKTVVQKIRQLKI